MIFLLQSLKCDSKGYDYGKELKSAKKVCQSSQVLANLQYQTIKTVKDSWQLYLSSQANFGYHGDFRSVLDFLIGFLFLALDIRGFQILVRDSIDYNNSSIRIVEEIYGTFEAVRILLMIRSVKEYRHRMRSGWRGVVIIPAVSIQDPNKLNRPSLTFDKIMNYFDNQKHEGNSKLLALLSKREKQTICIDYKQEWPGKRRPSFTSTLTFKKRRDSFQKTNFPRPTLGKSTAKTQARCLSKSATRVSASEKTISLRPFNGNIGRFSQTSRDAAPPYQKQMKNSQSVGPISNHENVFQNAKLSSNLVKEITMKQRLKNESGSKNMVQLDGKGKPELENYVIDFMAFNYIGKVIDHPRMWSMFVHKRPQNSQNTKA